MDREGGRSMSSLSPNWRTKALSNQDSALNFKDTSGSNLRIKLMQAASRLGGLMTDFAEKDVNGSQPCDLNLALLPSNLEHTPAIPQVDLKRRVEHLHGPRCEVPICSFIQNGTDWRDPVCTLFQTNNRTTCTLVENPAVGGSCTLATQLNERDATSRRFCMKDSAGADRAGKENVLLTASKSSENVTRRLPPTENYYQENLFRDMRFSLALIERAILLHGVEADVSVILQFLLDRSENNDLLGSQIREQADHSDIMLPIKEFQSTEESVCAVLRVRQHVANLTKKKEARQRWGSEDSDSSNNGFDDDEDGATPLKPGSPIDWTADKGPDYLVSLCKREPPTEEGHRHLISSLGFAAALVDRAIQELGEGVDYEMLLEYLLYLTSQQDPTASTPRASRGKRASTAKKPLKEWTFPNKRQGNYKKQICTVEKLVDECGYPAKAVERAVIICGTPLWRAEEDQVADVVDFLAAHVAELNESEDKAHIDEDPQEDTDCSWLRQLLEENESTGGRGKRKVDSVGVSRRKSFVRLSSQSNVKREHYDQLPLNNTQFASTMPRVKLVPSQQRSTPVCRIGRPRMLSMGVSISVARHEGSVGFGLPGNPVQPRYLDEDVIDAPFFYFENVASMPNDEWDRIRRHLFDIEPEFVDSLHFSACRRPRGYIHNLPIDGRRKILADPPMTIQDLLPHTKPFWPAWDPRTKLNCITTRMGSEFLIKKLHIREGTALQTAEPSPEQQREILHLCRHWNLVWTSPNIPTPIDEIEIEAMLGFDPGHSRNILSNRSRYKALGNSFSVHTVAFHFSVLKPLYPDGVKVLSLFSGIGGAEVALHKMGIKLLVVVSVEIDDGTRRCLEAWWATSKQTGVLNQNYHNIKDLGRAQISELVNTYGGFDLIVGGTPCNNLSGNNHVTRVGLDGKQSTIFFEFSRVVTAVRDLTIRLRRKI